MTTNLDIDNMILTINGETHRIDWFEVDGMNQANELHLVDGRVFINHDDTWVLDIFLPAKSLTRGLQKSSNGSRMSV